MPRPGDRVAHAPPPGPGWTGSTRTIDSAVAVRPDASDVTVTVTFPEPAVVNVWSPATSNRPAAVFTTRPLVVVPSPQAIVAAKSLALPPGFVSAIVATVPVNGEPAVTRCAVRPT